MTPPGSDPPEMGRMDTPTTSGSIHSELPKSLMDLILKEGSVPAVAFGEDQGSQRSAMTLAFRMWPLTSHIRRERAMWTEGFKRVNALIVKLAVANKLLPQEALKLLPVVKWYSITPRDRLDLVNEMVLRKQAGLISTKHALIMLGQGEDLDDEIAEIEKDQKAAADLAMQQKQKVAEDVPAPTASTREAVE
jgi:hypothetical protein